MRPEHKNRITIDPRIMVGQPVITGTRIPVHHILRMVADEENIDNIFLDYPGLTLEDIHAALHFAADVLENEEIFMSVPA